jgi:tetratricopeptide (TPR) repeat protein
MVRVSLAQEAETPITREEDHGEEIMTIDRNQDLLTRQYQNETRRNAQQHQLAGETQTERKNRLTVPPSLKNPRLLAVVIVLGLFAAALVLPGTVAAQNYDQLDAGAGLSLIEQDFQFGLYWLSYDEFELAGRIFSDVIDADPEHAGAYAARSITLYYLEDYEGAVADSEAALALSPDYASPYWILGNVCFDQEDYQSAQIAFETYLDLATDYVDPEIIGRLEICRAMIEEIEA